MSASSITARSSTRSRAASSRTAWRCCTASGNGTARDQQSLDQQIHLPRRLLPGAQRGQPAIERSGLLTTDIEVLRLHYAETLRHWRRRFAANRDTIAVALRRTLLPNVRILFVELRIGFPLRLAHGVFQIQLAHQQTAVPLTRDYITEADGQFAGPQQRGPDWSNWEQDRARGTPRARPDWR